MHVQHTYPWLTAIIVCLFSPDTFAQNESDRILGQWYTEGGKAIFDFYRSDEQYCARLIPLEKPEMLDSRNPADSLKTRKLFGITSVYGLTYDSKKKQWLNGKIYNPEDGRTYSCYCLLKNGETQLYFRGFLGVSILGGTQTWTRDKITGKR